ncbi:MAG: homoserine dehydrogenase [Alphaproteobacteria bacterium]|nr:homoserine dehydrogenase [Alphaproteobacteria bacterium]
MATLDQKPLRVALAGLGTVGIGAYKILMQNASVLEERTGRQIVVTAISARNQSKDRGVDLAQCAWEDNPVNLASRDDVDVIIEAMGGENDPAYTLVKTALENKKHVVTANKALLAYHGVELAEIAERNNVSLCYEAAVAGGIPIIKMIREGLGANRISGLYGIMNGTCNYILTTMERTGEDFAKVLKDAQELGYAEADPTLDIGGGDSGHKLVLLSALAYGCLPDFKNLSVEGIDHLEAEDIEIAAEFGCRIKLIGQATKLEDGRVLQMVAPSLVPKTSPLAHVDGVLNGIFVQGDFVGSSFVEGRGAGEGPTASAIIADVMEIAKGHCAPVFGVPSGKLEKAPTATAQDWRGEFYVRLVVEDRPGVIADIAPILRDHTISIESLIQRGRSEKEPVNIVIMTHDAKGEDIRAACAGIADLPCVLGKPLLMPVLKI